MGGKSRLLLGRTMAETSEVCGKTRPRPGCSEVTGSRRMGVTLEDFRAERRIEERGEDFGRQVMKVVGREEESVARAHAWLRPLPPGFMQLGPGRRRFSPGVGHTDSDCVGAKMSTLEEPRTKREGELVAVMSVHRRVRNRRMDDM